MDEEEEETALADTTVLGEGASFTLRDILLRVGEAGQMGANGSFALNFDIMGTYQTWSLVRPSI